MLSEKVCKISLKILYYNPPRQSAGKILINYSSTDVSVGVESTTISGDVSDGATPL